MQSSWLEGKIAVFNKKNGYGYLSHPEHDKILVHSRSLGNGVDAKMIYPGLSVRFKIEEVRTGYVARLVTPMEKVETVPETFAPRKVPSLKRKKTKSNDAEIARGPLQESSKPKTASDYIATALAFREQKRYVDARRAFQEGMSQSPSVQLVLSFAALERNLNRPAAAREVYRHGVDLFPESQKLHEDAGALELRIGNAEQAVQYFQRALELSPTKGTRRNLHRFLGSAFFKLSVDKDLVIDNKLLVKAKHNLERARGSLGHREVNLLNRINAILADRNIAKGFRLFEVAGFVVTQISKPGTHGVDFIVEASIEELRTTYGLQEAILVRHLLAGPRPDELRHIDKKLQGLVEEERADPNLAFILLKRSGPMMTALRRRLESGGKSTTIVPIELTANRKNGQPERLRNILDQWLF